MSEEPQDDDNEPEEAASDPPDVAEEDARDAHGGDDAADDPDHGKLVHLPIRVTPAYDLSGILNPEFSKLVLAALPDMSKIVLKLPDLSAFMPNINLSERIIPALELSGLIPKIDYSSLFPKIELAGPILNFSTFVPKLTLPDIAPAFASIAPALASMLEQLRETQPPNWSDDIDLEQVLAVIQEDGLPLVWLPRAEIVAEVLDVPNRAARVEVLLRHADELIVDCRAVLAAVGHETLAGQLPLAARAVDALEAGHHEAAQALAVVVTETAVARAISGKYENVKKQVLFDPDLVPYTEMRLRAALAPIGPFYTTWYASSGTPAPEALSRHVTVHQADHTHYTEGNAMVAVLLATSVLRALQELHELAEASENDAQSA
jgi:hypothetical protein